MGRQSSPGGGLTERAFCIGNDQTSTEEKVCIFHVEMQVSCFSRQKRHALQLSLHELARVQ